MKWIYTAVVCLLINLNGLFATDAYGNETPHENPEIALDEKSGNPDKHEINKKHEVRRDPFVAPGDFNDQLGGSDGMVRADGSLIPPGIRVRGILHLKGEEPVAILDVPGCPDPFFVREQEVVRIETGVVKKKASLPARVKSGKQSPPPHLLRLNPSLRTNSNSGYSKKAPSLSSGSALSGTTDSSLSSFYLYISKIGELYVEAFPKARPDDKQIFR